MNGSGQTQIPGLIIRTGFMVNRITFKLMRIVLFCGKEHTGTGMIWLASLMLITSVNDCKYAKLFICLHVPFVLRKILKMPDAIGLIRSPWVFLVPIFFYIILFSYILASSVPDEGYSRNASCALYLISTFIIVCPFGHCIVCLFSTYGLWLRL